MHLAHNGLDKGSSPLGLNLIFFNSHSHSQSQSFYLNLKFNLKLNLKFILSSAT